MEKYSISFFLCSMNLLVATTQHATTGTWFQKMTDSSDNAFDIVDEYFHKCSLKLECKFLAKDLEKRAFKVLFDEKDLPTDKRGSAVWKKMRTEYPVQWATGDGSGGIEEHIGTFKNKEECYMKCLTKRKNGKLANGVTVDAATGKSCYCEYGQTGRNGNTVWINTFIRRS